MIAKISNRRPVRLIWIVAIGLFALIGFGLVLFSVRWGAALSDDSYYYISAARNLLAGKGFDLVANFPPLLSLLLSLIGLVKVDPLISIRWLNALLFGLNIYLVARIVYRLTRLRTYSLLAALFCLISSTLIMIHSWAMSEPLFISLTLTGVWFYITGDQKEGWRTPFFTGLCFGLAAATRYIGISLLLAGGIIWLVEAGKNIKLRLRNALIFSIVGILPLLLWMVRNQIVFGQPTNREFAWHLMPASMWNNMLNTILLWILPGRLVQGKEYIWLGGIIFTLVVLLGVYLLRNRVVSTQQEHLPYARNSILLLGLIIVVYIFILVISRSFFDTRIPMDERLLSPVLILAIILLVWFFSRPWKIGRWVKYGCVALLSLMILVTNFTRSTQLVMSYHEDGRGYAGARNHISETYAYLRNRPDIPVYSNAFAGIYFWTDRVTYPLPTPDNIPAMKADMARTGALLVIFDAIPVELYGTTNEELTQGLVEQIRLSEATIYRSP